MTKFVSFVCSLTLCATVLGCGDSGSGGTAAAACDAGEVQSALSGTCASGLGDLLACWMPAGDCVANIELSGNFDIVFDNGATLETMVAGSSATGRYVNAGGAECGTFDAPAGSTDVTITTNGGQEFVVQEDGDVACPGGEVVPLSDIEQLAVDNCTSSADPMLCTQPDIGDIPDIPTAGDLVCTDDSQCPFIGGEQWECCLSVQGTGVVYCAAPLTCDFI